jgi:hypothetical protein
MHVYHPLFCFNQDADLGRALLRNENVHSAGDWRLALEPVVAHSRHVFFQRAEVAVPRKLFAAVLDRIQRLRTMPGMAPS